MSWVIENFYVENGIEAPRALRANAQRVDLLKLKTQLFGDSRPRPGFLRYRCAPSGVLGEQHRFFQRYRLYLCPVPPGGDQPAGGNGFSTQSTMLSLGLSMASLDLFSEPPPLAANVTLILICPNHFIMNSGRGIVLGVDACQTRISESMRQDVIPVIVGTANTFVDHIGHASCWNPIWRACRFSGIRSRYPCPDRWGACLLRTCGS